MTLARAQERAGHMWQLEQPEKSLMLVVPDMRAFTSREGVFKAIAKVCAWGAPWMKPTAVIANHKSIRGIHRGCPGCDTHFPLVGKAPDGRNWTSIAGPYWRPFAMDWAKCWDFLLDSQRDGKASHLAGWAAFQESQSLASTIREAHWKPSGRRDASVIALRVAAGLQPSKRALPTILPEGLGKEMHLQLANTMQHPFTLEVPLSEPCKYALDAQRAFVGPLSVFRHRVTSLILRLKAVLQAEAAQVKSFCHPWLRDILKDRHIPLMRELTWVSWFPDFNFLPHYVLGFFTVGWVDPARTFVPKMTSPTCSVESLLWSAEGHNNKVMSRVRSSGDTDLDKASWVKSRAEFDGGSLLGPFYSLDDLPVSRDTIRLLRRFPIWEMHGGSQEPTCRNIDDGLHGGQNASVGLQFANRPADLDAVIALIRAFSEAFPSEGFMGATSDFKSAYRQATSSPDQSSLSVVAMWDADKQCPCFGLAAAQLFGHSAAPQNFCRIPDWCCFVTSRLLLLAFIHCIDDMINFERCSEAQTAFNSWRVFADACGWLIPDDKSPPPSLWFRVLGAFVDLSDLPWSNAHIRVAEDRVQKMVDLFNDILSKGSLSPALSGQIFGQLGFACSQFHGRWGRAKLRAFVRRQHDSGKWALNDQLRSSLHWWIDNLPVAPPRSVFVTSQRRHLVITYSDGEGSDAGVGVAAWCPAFLGDVPLAGFLEVPREIRKLWAKQKAHAAKHSSSEEEFRDIIEIEAVGPLVMLSSWPSLFQNALWMHFIDNNSALGGLVKGSASVGQMDIVIGHTWSFVAQLQVLPWFDRVDSASNPVDGLSRKDFSGTWNWQPVSIPTAILEELKLRMK